MHKRSLLRLLSLPLLLPARGVFSQSALPKTVRVVVPLPAGSGNDFNARLMMGKMAGILGVNFVIDNKAGANGVIGTMDVVRAKPDGQTLLFASNSPIAANVAFVKNLPYDPRRDFTAIAAASVTNHVLLVKASSPVRNFAEFIDYAKQRPGKVSVGYSTASVQVQVATMNKMAGIQLLAVPYKGTPATVTDVIGGVIDATMTDPSIAQQQIKGGHLRALAVGLGKRNPLTPDWPAISETLPGFDFPSWNALVGPADMPRALVDRLNDAMRQVQQQTDVIERLAAEGKTMLTMRPDELRKFIDAETTTWTRLAQDAGIQPE